MVNGFRNITEASHSSTRCACDEETTHFGYQGLCPVKPGKLGNPQSGGRGGSIFLPAEGCWSLAVTHVSPPAALSTRGGMDYSFLPRPTHFLFPGPYKCKQPHSPNLQVESISSPNLLPTSSSSPAPPSVYWTSPPRNYSSVSIWLR